jgi:xanthine dioxygenase
MTIEVSPLPLLPPSANPAYFADFGRELHGVDPGNLDKALFSEIEKLLYKV